MAQTRREWRERAARGSFRTVATRIARFLLLVFLAFLLLESLLVFSVRVGAESMAPTLKEGDRLLVTPLLYGPRFPALGFRLPGFRKPRRGDIVVVRPPYAPRQPFLVMAADRVLSFFTARQVSLVDLDVAAEAPWVVKRVVAVPGDSLRIEDFGVFIRSRGSDRFVSEIELGSRLRSVDVLKLPEWWRDTYPFSAAYPEVELEEGQYFVLGDNRASSFDSRHWGSVPEEAIFGVVFARYWPVTRLGRP